jgi:hypothetical protein
MALSFFNHGKIVKFFMDTKLLTPAEFEKLKTDAKNPPPGQRGVSTLEKAPVILSDKDDIKIRETDYPIHTAQITITAIHLDGDEYMYMAELFFDNNKVGGRHAVPIAIEINSDKIPTYVDKNLMCLNPVTISISTPTPGTPSRMTGTIGLLSGGRRKTKRHHKKYRGSRKVHGRRRR